MATLQSFIEQYLKNKKISDYDGWLATYGTDSRAAYEEAKMTSDNLYAASRAEHGQRAASLYDRGLSGSGYSDYLNTAAYVERARARENALTRKLETDGQNKQGYLSYLASEAEKEQALEKEEQKKISEAFNHLLTKKVSDVGAAKTYLVSQGIDEKVASTLASQAVEVYRGTDEYRDYVIDQAIVHRYYYPAAYNYALLQGMSPAMADEIAKIVSYAVASQQYTNINHSAYYEALFDQ